MTKKEFIRKLELLENELSKLQDDVLNIRARNLVNFDYPYGDDFTAAELVKALYKHWDLEPIKKSGIEIKKAGG